jgi:hypothetical protein
VEIDGKRVGQVRARGSSNSDVSFDRFWARRGRPRTLALVAPDGTRRTMVLDDAIDVSRGWVVAPEAAEHDLCIVQQEVVYGAASRNGPKLEVVSGAGDLFPVPSGIEDPFVPPPATVETKDGPVTRTVLRGYVCSELEARRLVPYRDRSAPPPAAR